MKVNLGIVVLAATGAFAGWYFFVRDPAPDGRIGPMQPLPGQAFAGPIDPGPIAGDAVQDTAADFLRAIPPAVASSMEAGRAVVSWIGDFMAGLTGGGTA